MNEDINELFGDLRSMLSSRDYEPRELFWLLDGAFEEDPEHYRDQWHHYLRAYSPIQMLVTSPDEVDRLEDLLPEGVPQHVTLSMTHHHLRKWHFQQIADSPGAWFLRGLDISHNQAKNHYPAAFAHTETLLNLRTLNMAYCDLHNLVAIWVLRAPFLEHVEDLNLAGNPLEFKDVEAFAGNPHISAVTRLNLAACTLDTSKLALLLDSPHLGLLQHLDLSENPLTSNDLLALSRWSGSQQLQSLEWPWKQVTPVVRQRVVESGHFSDALRDHIFEQTMPSGKKKKGS